MRHLSSQMGLVFFFYEAKNAVFPRPRLSYVTISILCQEKFFAYVGRKPRAFDGAIESEMIAELSKIWRTFS